MRKNEAVAGGAVLVTMGAVAVCCFRWHETLLLVESMFAVLFRWGLCIQFVMVISLASFGIYRVLLVFIGGWFADFIWCG